MIVLVQISDIHFRANDSKLLSRVNALRGAILALYPGATAYFLLFSGDVANTGDSEEYKTALQFTEKLKAALTEDGERKIHVIAIPGNHDLNLRSQDEVRENVLENPEAYVRRGVDFRGAIFKSVIAVQDNFFSFAEAASGIVVPNDRKLLYEHSVEVDGKRVLFHCFNTAWLSRRNEQQGKLFIPTSLLDSTTPSDVALSVALLHHPYNWLDANNQRAVREFVESQTDVALTGHEHDPAISRVQRLGGQSVDYFAAPAFSDSLSPVNGIQLLAVDFGRATQAMHVLEWEGSRFTETKSESWELHRNWRRPVDPLSIRTAFLKSLDAIGTGFSHPRCIPPHCELLLHDLFVYPDLARHTLEDAIAGKGSAAENFSSSKLASFVTDKRRVLIFGADDAGKTTLGKVLFQDLLQHGQLPLLISGSDLKGVRDDRSVVKRLSATITEQYNSDSAEPYLQAPANRRALIIDDFDQAKLPRAVQKELVNSILSRFGQVVAIASDIFEIQDIASTKDDNPFSAFERCTIKQFGRYHRQRLIELWLRLGQEDQSELNQLDKKVAHTDKMLSTLLGRNVLPHHPVTILTLLQMLESREPTNTANGAYGYMYEVLIKRRLAQVDRSKVDEKITYISRIGYHLFKSGSAIVSDADLRRLHDEYCSHYDLVRDYSRTTDELVRAEVLTQVPSGWRFKYPYAYYYAAAKYLQDNAAALRSEMQTAADHIYGETNANVLIFYVYLTKDEELIRHIVESAKRIYADVAPCNLDGDVEFLNKLMKHKPPPLELDCSDSSAHRDEFNRTADAAEQNSQIEVADEITYNDQLQDIIKLSIAFKTLQLLGQILRNFTGSLPGSLKLEITRECYALGMRTLSAILRIPANNLEAMRHYLGSLIAERTGISDKQKLADRTDNAIVFLGGAAAFGSVKRISYAVGHGDLANTYGRVLEADPSIATRVIDAAIKRDHFETAPEIELKRLVSDLDSNFFTYRLMRDLIADYLYLYELPAQTMQMLGSMWNIKVSLPKYLVNRLKR